MATPVETELAPAIVLESPTPAPVSLNQRVDQALRYALPLATGLVVLGVILRFVSTSQLWLDEALSVNISKLPLGQIPGALRHDGAPPLYYVMLHYWMMAFGEGNFAVRALSGVISVAALPFAWLAGKHLGGRRMAWATLLLLASSPFAIGYATDTRMYALMILWALLGFLAVARALEQPTTRRLVCVGALTAAILYTHYWGIYLVGVTGLWLLVRAKRGAGKRGPGTARAVVAIDGAVAEAPAATLETAGNNIQNGGALQNGSASKVAEASLIDVTVVDQPADARRQASWSCFLAMLLGSLAFLPWVPSFVFQTLHTGTPWSNAAGLGDILTVIGQYAGGGPWGAALGFTLFTLVLLGVFAESVDRHHVLIKLQARAKARPIAVVFLGTLLVAVIGGTIAQAAFVGRYTAAVFPFFILLAALGVTVFADRRVMAAVLAWTVACGLIVGVGSNVSARTQAGQVASVINKDASPNDVVVYCPDQLGPATSRLITVAVQQFTFPRADPPERIDWVNYRQAITVANVQQFADEMLSVAAGHDIWFVMNPNYPGTEHKCTALMNWLSAQRNSQLWVADNPSVTLENESLFRFPV